MNNWSLQKWLECQQATATASYVVRYYRRQKSWRTAWPGQHHARTTASNQTEISTCIKLLLVLPASSATAERTFSNLTRLKTWLSSTMSTVKTKPFKCVVSSSRSCQKHVWMNWLLLTSSSTMYLQELQYLAKSNDHLIVDCRLRSWPIFWTHILLLREKNKILFS